MRKRTAARELALQALYQQDLRARMKTASDPDDAGTPQDTTGPDGDLQVFLREAADDPAVLEYATWIVEGAMETRDELDRQIAAAARNWKLNRIAPIDRCILRLALFELYESDEVPPKVAIDEAINLAKKFSTEQSGAFVNGILDRMYGDLRREGLPAQKKKK